MMSDTKAFRVRVIADLGEREWQTLAIVTRLTSTRARSYVFDALPGEQTDIYLADGDSPAMRKLWESAKSRQAAPTVFLTARPGAAGERHEFRRPMTPSTLLGLVKLLDGITIRELSFVPELCIGEGEISAPDSLAISTRDTRFSALVVDDSPTILAQVGLILNMSGVAADFAGSAEMALDFVARNTYDIAFLDVVLPGNIDGYQICKRIKKDKSTKHTAVIMLTSKSSPFDRVRASLAGCDAFLTKPVENDLFLRTMRKYLAPEPVGEVAHPLPAL